MLTDQCSLVMSGITTWSLDSSGSEASTKGLETSTRRPVWRRTRSTKPLISMEVRAIGTDRETPPSATNTWSGPLTQTSSSAGSATKSSRVGGLVSAVVCIRQLWRECHRAEKSYPQLDAQYYPSHHEINHKTGRIDQGGHQWSGNHRGVNAECAGH